MNFTQDTLTLLTELGYVYLVVDHRRQVAYARKNATPQESLDFLSLVEFKIDMLGPQEVSHFAYSNVAILTA